MELLEADSFVLQSFDTLTGLKFFVTADPDSKKLDQVLREVYELYSDYVLKVRAHAPPQAARVRLRVFVCACACTRAAHWARTTPSRQKHMPIVPSVAVCRTPSTRPTCRSTVSALTRSSSSWPRTTTGGEGDDSLDGGGRRCERTQSQLVVHGIGRRVGWMLGSWGANGVEKDARRCCWLSPTIFAVIKRQLNLVRRVRFTVNGQGCPYPRRDERAYVKCDRVCVLGIAHTSM